MEDSDSSSKSAWKPKFVSEFSMGQYDFERYNKWLEHCENWSAQINSTANPQLHMIQSYFSGLNVLWKQWRPIISIDKTRDEIDKKIKDCREKKRVWEDNQSRNTPFEQPRIREIIDSLDDIHTRLMEIKQIIGLGIVIRRNFTTKEKIRSGIKGGREYTNLPEP